MDGSVRLLDVPLGSAAVADSATLDASGQRVVALAWSFDGKTLAAADAKSNCVRVFRRGDRCEQP